MFKNLTSLMTVVSALSLSACATDAADSGTGTGAIIEVPCAEGPECPAGFECEVEDEHGVVTSWCQADEDADAGCPAGYELEIEHGQAFCKPHGGDDGAAGDDDGAGDDNGGAGNDDPAGDDNGGAGNDDPAGDDNGGAGNDDAPQGDECAVDVDCGAGLECEDGLCIPHGGDLL